MAPAHKKPTSKADNALETLPGSLASTFDQVQSTLANHRKNCVALYKVHQQAAGITKDANDGKTVKLVGEKAFGDAFIDLVNRVLVVKKGPPAAEKVVRFVGGYVKFLNEKALAEKTKAKEDPSSSVSARLNGDNCDDEDTFGSRFVTRLLKWLLRGFQAKNKVTRYRSVSFVAEMIAHIGEVDEDLYNMLREGLLDRISDKESLIRVHAVIALSKLIGTEDPDEAENGEQTILDVLLDIASYDLAPEVRRAALLNIPVLPTTLEVILSRARDTDILTRKLVYSNVLLNKLGHPRHLTIAQREQIVKDGLGDREPSVRVAAGKLVASWYDLVLPEPDGEVGAWEGDDAGVMKGFVKFLGLFDVVGPGEVVAVDAMLSIFVMRPAVMEVFVFPDNYWKELTPESAVLARVFLEHSMSSRKESVSDLASLPVVTAFAFHLQEQYNKLVGVLQEAENYLFLNGDEEPDEEEVAKKEEELAKQEVILGQLLRMALDLDYMDEIGRRKLFSVVRDMVAHPELPPGLINPSMDVLKVITTTERDLIRVVVEIIIDLREGEQDPADDRSVLNGEGDGDTTISSRTIQRTKTRETMSLDERMEADVMDLRCLTLCIGMLERVNGTFEDNSTLEGILADLIIPSIKRKELPLREKGLISLGLCCLIAKNMALSSLQLFLNQVQTSPTELKLRVLQVIFDLLIMYDQEFLKRSEEITKRIIDFMLQTLDAEDSPALQALICVGLSKLLLAGIVTDARVLTALLLTYVSPTTSGNQELRQCLSYFIPVYCYSSSANQSRIQAIFITTLDLFMRMYEGLDEEQQTISPFQFGLYMVDWINPLRRTRVHGQDPGDDTHMELAIDILVALYDTERSADAQRVLLHLLGQLGIMPDSDLRSFHKLNVLLEHLEKFLTLEDDAVHKLFTKFRRRFQKLFAKWLRNIQPGKYLDQEFIDIYNFIGIDPPEPCGEDVAPDVEEPAQSQSLVPDETEGEAGPSSGGESRLSSPTPSPLGKNGKSKPSTRRSKTVQNSFEEMSAPEDDIAESVPSENTPSDLQVSTPKKKGIKRLQATSPAKSPARRKRGRTSGSHRPPSGETSSEESDLDEEEVGSLPPRFKQNGGQQFASEEGSDDSGIEVPLPSGS